LSQSVRRVVTGTDEEGQAGVVSDGPARVHAIGRPGMALADIWATSQTPPPITPAEPDPVKEELDFAILTRGTRFRILDSVPGGEGDEPWMHRTETIDYAYVIEGEMCLLLDKGVEVVLREGDTVVQRGTNHAWVNRSSARCRMIFVMIGGEFSEELSGGEPFSADELKASLRKE